MNRLHVLALIIAASCSSGKSDKKSKDEPADSPVTTPLPDPGTLVSDDTIDVSPLVGEWRSDCFGGVGSDTLSKRDTRTYRDDGTYDFFLKLSSSVLCEDTVATVAGVASCIARSC